MIVQKSLVEMACEEIKRLISHGELVAGQRIVEVSLAQQLGVSRPSLREALRILATRRILQFTPRHGYRVVGLTEEDAQEIYSLRRVLEEFGLGLMLERLDEVDFAPLRETMTRMWGAARAGNESEVGAMHREFHTRVVGFSGHKRLTESYAALMDDMELYMARSVSTDAQAPGGLLESCARHEKLVDILEAREPAAIAEALKAHAQQTEYRVNMPALLS